MYCHTNPSLPNYLCLTSGRTSAARRTRTELDDVHEDRVGATNIVDRLESAGLTWKGYMEDMPNNCYATDSGNYVVHHNPSCITTTSRATRRVAPRSSLPAFPDSDATLLADSEPCRAHRTSCGSPRTNATTCTAARSTRQTRTCRTRPEDPQQHALQDDARGLFVTYDEGYDQPVYTVWRAPLRRRAICRPSGMTTTPSSPRSKGIGTWPP